MKRIISVILSVLFLTVPFAACKEHKKDGASENIVMAFQTDGDMSVKKGEETLVESKYSYTYYVFFKDTENSEGASRYLLEDSALKKSFYSEFSGKEITLKRTEEPSMPKGLFVRVSLPFNKAIDFTVTEDGSVWRHYLEDDKIVYYSSEIDVVDYADIYEIYNALDYEYPYTLKRTDDGQIVFETEEESVFSFNQEDIDKATITHGIKDSNIAWIDDEAWIKVLFDIVFKKEIAFRECVENSWKEEVDVDILFTGSGLENHVKLYFCYGGYIYFYDRVSEKYYVSTFGVMDTTSLGALKIDWIRIQYGY